MSKVTVKQAASLTGKSRETINTATNDGILSYSLNSRKHKVIAVSELERVFPLVKTMEQVQEESDRVSIRQITSEPDIQAELTLLREKLQHAEQQKDTLQEERDREREQLQSQIETLRQGLETAQEHHGKAMLLITDQSQAPRENWQQLAQDLEIKIAQQEAAFDRRVGELRQETISDLKNLPWWQLVFAKA